MMMGASILYNLVFMLAAFLASEGVKNYQKNFTWGLLALGVMQIVRIFILPMQAHSAVVKISGVETIVMQDPQFIRVLIYLVGSAVCLVAAALINYRKYSLLQVHEQELSAKEAVKNG